MPFSGTTLLPSFLGIKRDFAERTTAMNNVLNALTALEIVAQNPGMGVSEIARRLRLPKSTVQRSLKALEHGGWIAQAGIGRRAGWLASPRLLALINATEPAPRLRESALPHMRRLRDRTGETIHLMAPIGCEMVLIERLDSTQYLRTVRQLGMRAPLHVGSNGKAVLAAMSDGEADTYLAGPLVAWTPQTLTDPDVIRAEIAGIRACGYAVSRGELDPDVNSVAAAITGSGARAVGSVSISCPATRLPEERIPVYGPMVAEVAAEIERDLAGEKGPV